MKRPMQCAWVALALLPLVSEARAQDRARYETMIAKHAHANLVPEALVHRLIVRESKYNPALVGHGATIGLMQIKLATAKGVGYTGDAEGLRDPETNLAYGVKYLAGAYRAAGGDPDHAIRYFAGGYYYAAKRQRLDHLKQGKPDLDAAPPKIAKVEDKPAPAPEDAAVQDETAPPADTGKREDAAAKSLRPLQLVPAPARLAHRAKSKSSKKKLADAKVPRPPAAQPGSVNSAKPR